MLNHTLLLYSLQVVLYIDYAINNLLRPEQSEIFLSMRSRERVLCYDAYCIQNHIFISTYNEDGSRWLNNLKYITLIQWGYCLSAENGRSGGIWWEHSIQLLPLNESPGSDYHSPCFDNVQSFSNLRLPDLGMSNLGHTQIIIAWGTLFLKIIHCLSEILILQGFPLICQL